MEHNTRSKPYLVGARRFVGNGVGLNVGGMGDRVGNAVGVVGAAGPAPAAALIWSSPPKAKR